jgi:hypothetical protein
MIAGAEVKSTGPVIAATGKTRTLGPGVHSIATVLHAFCRRRAALGKRGETCWKITHLTGMNKTVHHSAPVTFLGGAGYKGVLA